MYILNEVDLLLSAVLSIQSLPGGRPRLQIRTVAVGCIEAAAQSSLQASSPRLPHSFESYVPCAPWPGKPSWKAMRGVRESAALLQQPNSS